jgi:hypothetical protein
MTKQIFRSLMLLLFALGVGVSSAFGAATIVILNNDAAGVGFNDTTAVAPVGGNTGTTLGQQRLNAFQAAADKWGATLTSSVTITIRAQWTALTCTATTAVLGSAGALQIFRDFPGVPFAGTWYNGSLTGKLTGSDPDATTPEISANFNVNLGQPGCLPGTFFYLGLDNNHGSNIDLVTVLTHEFGHGLGFQTFTDASTGAQITGLPSIYDRFLVDDSTGKSWFNMTNGERATSALNARKLAWNGPQVQTDVPSVLAFGVPVVKINSPAGIAGSYDAGTAFYGPALTAGGVTADMLLANDGTPPVTDGCEAFPAGFFNGKIAVIDRGTCSFKTKTLNAQNAGAVGVVIVNNMAGSPATGLGDDATIATPITIPTVSLTQSDGQLIEAQLGGTVNSTLQFDTTVRSGADPFGKALLFSPNPFVSGSSVSHYDTIAFPNQLMEPNINGDLTHEVTPPNDLTFSELRDIGWVASALPSSISKTTGDNQNAALNQPFLVPFSVTLSPAVSGITVTWTVNPNGAGAGATFASTSSRFATSTTDALGVATAPQLTANGQPGIYSMNATVPGAGTTTFNLANDPIPVAGPACATDTTQADFQGGVTNNTDVNTSPGDVILLSPATADQVQAETTSSGTGLNTTQWLGQTFVPAVSGQLAKIDLGMFCSGCSGTDQPITVEITTTTGSPALPTTTVLASTTIPGFSSGSSATYTATFATPATLTAGTTYAYTLRLLTARTGTYAAFFSLGPTAYANGNRVVSMNSGGTWTVPTSTGIARDLVFTTYMQTGFVAAGDFISPLKDSNPPAPSTSVWSTLSWNATTPANTTLQFQAAGSNSFTGPFNFVGPDTTSGTFFTTSPADITQFSGNRYLKYKAFLTTTNGTVTPALNDATACYNNPAPTPTATATATPTATATATPTATATATPTATATATPTATATATPTATATATPTATATATPTATATATPAATATATPTATATATPAPAPAEAQNISTRLRVETGDKLMIGGFIVTGNTQKKVVIRGMGPSLGSGMTNLLADPVLELRDASGALIRKNDNWKDDQRSEIEGTVYQPPDDREAVIVATLDPGAYTALLTGKGQTTGIGLVEIYDANQAATSKLANISTRGFVQTGNNVMIGGFMLGGNSGNTNIAVRGIGPSLSQFRLTGVLANPTLEMHNGNGTVMISNDDWATDAASAAQLTARGLAPQNPKESGIFTSLPPGAYTVVLMGNSGGTGIGLIEIYNVH